MTVSCFTEYEAFTDAVQDASKAMRISSLEESKWTLQNASAGALRLQRGYEGGGTIAEGATVPDGWVFFQQSAPVYANGQLATENHVFVAPPGGEFCLASKQAHEWFTVLIPASLLFQSSTEFEFASCAKPKLLKPPPCVTRRFTSLLGRCLSATEQRPQLLRCPLAVATLQSELLVATRQLFERSQHSASRQFLRWRGLTKTALELAIAHPIQSLSIADLSRQTGVPERTLRTAFEKCYGHSPINYLRIHRLHQARQLLLANCPDQTTVTQIALGLGFWELGRFAGAYRRLFGELPSESLRKPAKQQIVK
jgi:AraC family ethanolamine operon transcriptional activator